MASDTVPAAAPGPNEPASTPNSRAAQPGGIAALWAPIDPARPAPGAFTLDPDQAAAAGHDKVSTSASSAAYHDAGTGSESPDSGAGKGAKGSAGASKEGVLKTWLRATAERWRKGADIHIKRLEVQKARHQAMQVKESRQVAVNRTPGSGFGRQQNTSGLGGKTDGGKAGGKSGNGRNNSHTPAKQRPSSGSSGSSGTGSTGSTGSTGGGSPRGGKNGPSGGHGAPGSGGAGEHGTQRSGGTAPKQGKDTSSAGAGQKTGSGSGGSGSSGGSGGKGSNPGPAGKEGKQGKPGKDSAGKTSSGESKGTPADRTFNDRAARPEGKSGAGTDKSSRDKSSKDQPTSKQDGGKNSPADPAKKTAEPSPKDSGKAGPDGTRDHNTSPDKAADKPADPHLHTTGGGKPLNTQPSREAGYRDGTRAARAAAHVNAYRDGVRDGWTDGQQAAARDKARLDNAREQRQQHKDTDHKDQTMTAKTSADHHPTHDQPQPIHATNITQSHVILDNGQVRSRGEIRNLKQYERRLEDKVNTMNRVADAAKRLLAHAEEQAKHVTRLAEQAKAAKGGEKVLAALAKVQETTDLQAQQATELHKRALKGAENTTVLLSNVQTRYGLIYQAVCNSPLTKPAELDFYNDRSAARA
jgi:hypothetical protein